MIVDCKNLKPTLDTRYWMAVTPETFFHDNSAVYAGQFALLFL